MTSAVIQDRRTAPTTNRQKGRSTVMPKHKVEPKIFRLLLDMLRLYAQQLGDFYPLVVVRNGVSIRIST
jgi:hypothetical protein